MGLFGLHQSYYGYIGPIQYVNTWLVDWLLCGHKVRKLNALPTETIPGRGVQQQLCFYCSEEGMTYTYTCIYLHAYLKGPKGSL